MKTHWRDYIIGDYTISFGKAELRDSCDTCKKPIKRGDMVMITTFGKPDDCNDTNVFCHKCQRKELSTFKARVIQQVPITRKQLLQQLW